MQDFKLEIEVKVIAKPIRLSLGLDNATPVERTQMIVTQKALANYVGLKSSIATLAENAIKTLANNRGLLVALSPEVTTEAATSVTATSATINGTGHDHGTSTTLSFVTGTTRDPATARIATTGGTNNTHDWAAVTYNMTGLSANTRYYYRTKAVSAGGTVYGPLKSFITPAS